MPVSPASHWLAVCAPMTAWIGSPGRRYWAADSRMESRRATSITSEVSLAFMRAAVHHVPQRSTVGRQARKRPRSAGPVGAAHAGVHGLAQMLADDGVGFGDPGQRPADGLAHRDPGALRVVGEGPGPAAEPGRAGELGDQPVAFGPNLAGPVGFQLVVSCLIELGVQALEPVPVLGDRLVVEDALRR